MSKIASSLLPGEAIVYTAPLMKWPVYAIGLLLTPCYGIGLVFIVMAWLTFRSTEIVVTNMRVIRRTGILMASTDELRLEQIESVHAHADLQPRVEIVGSGGTKMKITGIASPDALRSAVMHAAHTMREWLRTR